MDIERTMEFILEQQAKFAIRMDEVQMSQVKLFNALERVTSLVERIVSMVEGVAKVQEGCASALMSLAEAQQHTDERLLVLLTAINEFRGAGSEETGESAVTPAADAATQA